ncbi:DUF3352 domain-containing protein [Novipirellula artificiosorum]|uniref:DUF3352 domain-containing protein n=1 Tax=Novipirellula artificiosorum TaxID=2528016 RepID=A0A5C6DZD8_9BACT|nr:DUF3352 domain-containing protein [Novipirellula artificiosorum]TWU42813.1 hypothetical protein Poly41_11140 [Novipirellula artificiosorum]
MLRFLAPLIAISVSVLTLAFPSDATAADEVVIPGSPHLLPEDTLLYLRIDNADESRVAMRESSVGRMLNDPKLRPFAGDIYTTAAELFTQISDEVGVTLDELLAIPRGQVAAAMMPGNPPDSDTDAAQSQEDEADESDAAIRRRIARKRREQYGLAGLFMVDAKENVGDLMAIIDRLEARMTGGGYVRRTSTIDKVELVRLLPPRPGRPEVEYFKKDGTVVFGIGHDTAAKALDHWLDRSEEASLSDNSNFGNVMSRCIGAEATRPQVTFYADPYRLVERLVKRGGAAALVWPILEDLGLKKIRGIGGSSFRGGETFEDINHLHVLIDTPRDGIFGVLRPETGDITAPDWVPSDVTAYSTVHWNFAKAYENLDQILALFQGEDPLKRLVEEPFEKATRMNFQEDIIDNLTGRYASATWLQPPVKLNSQVVAYAFELKDPEKAKSAIARFREFKPNAVKVETVAGSIVYSPPQPRRNLPQSFRQPEPGMTIVGNWIVLGDSDTFRERIIRAKQGGIPRLVEDSDFDLIVSELGGKLDGEKPFMVSFVRGADYLRLLYELAKSEDSRGFLRKAGEKNVVARNFSELLERNELPEYEAFEKYFAPGGVFGYNEPTGIHFGAFNLRAQ